MSNELVQVYNEEIVVSSRDVAERFSKRHDHVMRDIENLIPQNWGVRNLFHESTYINERSREYSQYLMNRDGFTLLAMGFTGKEALEWKLKYIEAFKQMEEQLKNQQHVSLPSYQIEDPIERAKQWIEEETERKQLALENEQKRIRIEEQKKAIKKAEPKVSAFDALINSEGLFKVEDIAQDYGMSAIQLNRLLKENDIQYKRNAKSNWVLKNKYKKRGYAKSDLYYNGDSNVTNSLTKWTPKGRMFIYLFLSNELGISPVSADAIEVLEIAKEKNIKI